MNTAQTFRVVGVRPDGSKRIVSDSIRTRFLGERIVSDLEAYQVFKKYLIEPESDPFIETPPSDQHPA